MRYQAALRPDWMKYLVFRRFYVNPQNIAVWNKTANIWRDAGAAKMIP